MSARFLVTLNKLYTYLKYYSGLMFLILNEKTVIICKILKNMIGCDIYGYV